ncbi:MAG: LacI family transcriptional regulator [Ancrocorticia sp.]|jgi:LacI family transcriptional regulator|nr:LacI family transcriptional regulator [Ancrocorticia sp.]MCI2002974.1 LacI family transcriptional regulator [Ancrocorticia sp.]MCI2013097.1 LacI family transcriptional regulator [Ancrocorticia sp.]
MPTNAGPMPASQPTNTPGRMPTRADVARLAGVSTAVVSYVINNGPRPVSQHNKEKVLNAIRILGYRPNASARALKLGSTQLLGFVVTEILNPFHAEFINSVDLAASQHGYGLMISSTHEIEGREQGVVSSLVEHGVDGLIFLSVDPQVAARVTEGLDIPRVLLDYPHPVPGFVTITSDAYQGACLATQHLVERGHQRIAYIEGVLPAARTNLRLLGWQHTVEKAGLTTDYHVQTTWDRAGGRDAVLRLFERPDPPSAIFAGSDLIAVGALQALHRLGKRAPSDVAIVSFDGTAETEFSLPMLTSVTQPFSAISEAAVAYATGTAELPGDARNNASALEGVSQRQSAHVVYPMNLVVRDSSGGSVSQ